MSWHPDVAVQRLCWVYSITRTPSIYKLIAKDTYLYSFLSFIKNKFIEIRLTYGLSKLLLDIVIFHGSHDEDFENLLAGLLHAVNEDGLLPTCGQTMYSPFAWHWDELDYSSHLCLVLRWVWMSHTVCLVLGCMEQVLTIRACLIGYVMHSSLSVCVTREGGIQLFWCHTEMSTVDLPMIGVWSPVGGILVERSCWKTTKARTLLTLNEIFSPEPGWSKNTANAAQVRSNVGIPMLTT